MKFALNRRQFVGSLAALPFALEAAIKAQRVSPEEAARLRAEAMSPFPMIDTHIHIFDKSRPGGMGYPRDMPGGASRRRATLRGPTGTSSSPVRSASSAP
jgi:hypothetical protein